MRRAPVQRRSKKTVDRIRQAARDVLCRDGVEGLTTNTIAQQAGVNISTLYGYYPDKYAILADLFDEYERQRIEIVRQRLGVLEEGEDWLATSSVAIEELAAFRLADPAQIALRRAINVIPSLRDLDNASTLQVAQALGGVILRQNPSIGEDQAVRAGLVVTLAVTHLLDEACDGENPDPHLIRECQQLFIRYLRPYLG